MRYRCTGARTGTRTGRLDVDAYCCSISTVMVTPIAVSSYVSLPFANVKVFVGSPDASSALSVWVVSFRDSHVNVSVVSVGASYVPAQ